MMPQLERLDTHFGFVVTTSERCISCTSNAARRFSAGDWRGGCRAVNEDDAGRAQWVTARGVLLPGLVKRRAAERALCETAA
jgi:GH24 family phage-related lysozyme (muramidase)